MARLPEPVQNEGNKMNLLPDRKTVRIAVWVCALAVFYEAAMMLKKNRLGLEPLWILQFMLWLYFFPEIKSRWRAILYGVTIPLFSCVMILTVGDIIAHLLRWELPFYFDGDDTVWGFILNWVLVLYVVSLSCVTSIFLILAYALCRFASRRALRHPEERGAALASPFRQAVMDTRLFRHAKLTVIVILIYYVFMGVYFKLYKSFWVQDIAYEWTYSFSTYVCLLSFMSFFIFAPAVVCRIRNILVFCVAAPLFWSVFIFVLWVVLILIFREKHLVFKTPFLIHISSSLYNGQPTTNILSLHFYLDRYLQMRAWLVGLPLLLICFTYARLLKSALARRTGMAGRQT